MSLSVDAEPSNKLALISILSSTWWTWSLRAPWGSLGPRLVQLWMPTNLHCMLHIIKTVSPPAHIHSPPFIKHFSRMSDRKLRATLGDKKSDLRLFFFPRNRAEHGGWIIYTGWGLCMLYCKLMYLLHVIGWVCDHSEPEEAPLAVWWEWSASCVISPPLHPFTPNQNHSPLPSFRLHIRVIRQYLSLAFVCLTE